MKISKIRLLLPFVLMGTAAFGQQSNLPDEIRPFIIAKEAQARALADKLDLKVAPEIWSYFETAKTGDYRAITNSFATLRNRSGRYIQGKSDPTIDTPVISAVFEVDLAAGTFGGGNPKFPLAFGHDLMDSIPHGAPRWRPLGVARRPSPMEMVAAQEKRPGIMLKPAGVGCSFTRSVKSLVMRSA